MWDCSPYDPAYAALYKQCTHHFPTALRSVPKPQPLPEHAQGALPQRTPHNHQALHSSSNHITWQHGLDLGDNDWSSNEDEEEEEQPIQSLPQTPPPLAQ